MSEQPPTRGERDDATSRSTVDQLRGLVDDGWHVVIYRVPSMHGRVYVVEASGGTGLEDDEIVGEGDTLDAAVQDLAEELRTQDNEEHADV